VSLRDQIERGLGGEPQESDRDDAMQRKLDAPESPRFTVGDGARLGVGVVIVIIVVSVVLAIIAAMLGR